MGCDVCKGPKGKRDGRRCARCRYRLRSAARFVRELLYGLTVLGLLDELADRVQVEDATVYRKLRGAAVVELRPRVVREVESDVADGWLLDAERAA